MATVDSIALRLRPPMPLYCASKVPIKKQDRRKGFVANLLKSRGRSCVAFISV